MTKITIEAHFLHTKQKEELKKMMPKAIETDSFLYGKINDKHIKKIKKMKIHYEIIKESKIIQTQGIEAQKIAPIIAKRMRGIRKKQEKPRLTVDKNTTTYYLIQLKGPLINEWKSSFQKEDVVFTQHIPINNYIAKLSPSQKNKVKKFSFVNKVRLYTTEDTNAVISDMIKIKRKQKISLKYDIRLHSDAKIKPVLSWLEKNEIKIIDNTENKIRVQLLENSQELAKIADLDEVYLIEEYQLPKPTNDVARIILGVDSSTGNLQLDQTGEDQIVGVADTGVDTTHPDLKKGSKKQLH